MQPETATAQLSGQFWRHVVVVAAMVSAIVGGVVVVAGRTMASEPGSMKFAFKHLRWINPAGSSSPSLNGDGSAPIAAPNGWKSSVA